MDERQFRVRSASGFAALVIVSLILALSPATRASFTTVVVTASCLILLVLVLILGGGHWTRFALPGVAASIVSGMAWPFAGLPALLALTRLTWAEDLIRTRHRLGIVFGVSALGLLGAVLAAKIWLGAGHAFAVSLPPVPKWLLIPMAALANSLVEEAVWRHAAWSELNDLFGLWGAVLLSSLAFGIAHWHGLPGGIVGVFGAALLGLVLGMTRVAVGFTGVLAVHFAVDIGLFWTILA